MEVKKYQAITAHTVRSHTRVMERIGNAGKEIDIVSRVLPFKTNNYVVDELIDWNNIPNDPIYTLTFPRRDMLSPGHFRKMEKAVAGGDEKAIHAAATLIQLALNPDPSGQSANVPTLHGRHLPGVQHKYRETVLFFPQAGQTCHAYCTFCFRWPQFCGLGKAKFSSRETADVVEYIRLHPKVTDLLLTGGDPMVMKAGTLAGYLEPFLTGDLEHLHTIRIGTKSLAYWPYRYLTDPDADEVIRLFEKVVSSGRNLAIMAHFNHPVELSTEAVQRAIRRIQATGAQIRTQSPLLRNINDEPRLWSAMWRKQVDLNCIPYYMFVERDTGAKRFFSLPLSRCWKIFQGAYQKVSGICRTVRGPVMSATPGKIQVIGRAEVQGEKVFVLHFVQGRNADWVERPFFARYDTTSTWLTGLKPAFGEKEFFFEKELKGILSEHMQPMG